MIRQEIVREIITAMRASRLSCRSAENVSASLNSLKAFRTDSASIRQASVFTRSFHSSKPTFEGEQRPPGKSPLQVFVDTFRQEWNKSQELQENIKTLQDGTKQVADSEAYKKAKEAYDRAKSGTSATAKTLKKAGEAVGSAASTAWESPVVKATRDVVHDAAEGIDKATAPIRETQVYKEVKEAIDDGRSRRYGGFEERETRRKHRLEREAKRRQEAIEKGIYTTNQPIVENTEVTGIELHKDAKPEGESETASGFSKSFGRFKEMYNESENGIISSVRSVTNFIGKAFQESETAQVVRMIREIDPSFTIEDFLTELREYILPEIIDAYVTSDEETLRVWLSDAPFSIFREQIKQVRVAGLYSASRVVDIRGADISRVRLLPPDDIPVLIVTCRVQEIHLFKNLKTNEVAAGSEDRVQMCAYVVVFTRVSADINDPETKGWKIIEMARVRSQDWT
ncbi:Tim44p [Lipomyces oligophaga]|uniref:Tim44p n=1 Tax=Lipomyces oligophaga TaxID=45792 RepID=UPI0034CDFB23